MELYTIPIRDADGPDKYILYRPLIGLAFVGNKAMANLTRAIVARETAMDERDPSVDFLQRIGFLEPDPCPPQLVEAEFSPTMAVLLLTNQCQLRCTYCYAAAGEAARQELSFELGKAAIDRVCQNAQMLGRDSFDISFHGGGEPTLAWKTMVACVSYARQKPLPARIDLQSNGIWSRAKRTWLIDHLDSLSLSMDGSPPTQDRQRPYLSGRGSSSTILQTIAELDERKFPYGIRMTATAPWENFPRDVRYLCESTQCRGLQVEPAFNAQRGGHRNPQAEEARAFAEAFLEAHEIATNAGRELTYAAAILGQVTPVFCTAPYDALIVTPNGTLVTCYEVTNTAHSLAGLSTIGRIDDGLIQLDPAARAALHGKIAERRAACQDCFCYWSCAGDCYARSFGEGEQAHLQYGARCESNRFITEQLLLDGIAAGGGVWKAYGVRELAPVYNASTPVRAVADSKGS